jgi:hypothetical protein
LEANVAAVGNGPFEFTDPNGRQVSIPLSSLSFNTSGVLNIDSSKWPPYASYNSQLQAVLTALLADYVREQTISQPSASTPQPAMVINAADPGPAGNNITVGIAVTPGSGLTNTTFDVTVTETETYAGLTTATIEAIVGTEAAAGSQPGLAHVVSASLHAALLPANHPAYTFPAAAAGVKATVDVLDGSSAVVFTLEAKKPGPDAQFMTATISASESVHNTFTLTLTWSHAVTGAKLLTVQTDLAPLGYEIAVAPPASGAFWIPAPTSSPISLSGGNATTAASATIFTGN